MGGGAVASSLCFGKGKARDGRCDAASGILLFTACARMTYRIILHCACTPQRHHAAHHHHHAPHTYFPPGTGGIKPNVSAFGADQFNEADPRDRREKESFFNWFYLAVNVGSLIASIVIVYIQDSVRCVSCET